MEKKVKITLSNDYENELSIIVTVIVDGNFVVITDIELDKKSSLNDFVDFLSQAALKQVSTAYKLASITCGKEKDVAEEMAKKYSKGIKNLYQLIENRVSEKLLNDV